MRRPLIAGNWKMNLTRGQSLELVNAIAAGLPENPAAEVAVFPPFPYLDAVLTSVMASKSEGCLAVGGQNVSASPNGALTGEVSCQMLVDLGATAVIVGHSERRAIMGESSGDVNKKAVAALAAGLTPVVCVGELLEERQAGKTDEVVLQQCAASLAGFSADQISQVVIAYEPVWAIGTGQVATPEQAEEVHASIRRWLEKQFSARDAQEVRILYGGSVKPDNAAELLTQENIDGALVGGASLNAASFLGIVQACRAEKVC